TLNTTDHCTGSDGTGSSGARQLPDRISPESGKCTLDTRYSNIYLQKFLYGVDDDSTKRQVENDQLLCKTMQDLKQAFAAELAKREQKQKNLKLLSQPTCKGNTAIYRYQANGITHEVEASAGSKTGKLTNLRVLNMNDFREYSYQFSGEPLAAEGIV